MVTSWQGSQYIQIPCRDIAKSVDELRNRCQLGTGETIAVKGRAVFNDYYVEVSEQNC